MDSEERPPRNFDKDPMYVNPCAWRNMKAAFRHQNRLDRLFARMERIARSHENRWGEPRIMLAFALHHYVNATSDERWRMERDYWHWCEQLRGAGYHRNDEYPMRDAPDAERLPRGEVAALAADLADAARKLDGREAAA